MHPMGGLINPGNKPFCGLLNRSIVRYFSWLSWQILCMFLLVYCSHGWMMKTLHNTCQVFWGCFLIFSEIKSVSMSENIFLGSPYSENIISHVFIKFICAEPLHMLYDKELAVVIYNLKIILVINGTDVSSYRFPQPPWYFMWQCLVLWSCCLKIKTSWNFIFIIINFIVVL